ncbi:ankyrin repeat-containing domain protein [Penicillium canariense]|uniref:Ankyrin repeat-containing domain protein n=1 Tax=Penicillium canariense TaxID=189055 RepID=A0A9W9HNB3_9EURO|nr:ankyrin repeat-containing domain protein [Penicillium canariense]KAJ5153393.1 ankyrin repeat-containing domain protein [Penicillium canariense]
MFSPPLSTDNTLQHDNYTVGWICPLEIELIAALEMLDEEHPRLSHQWKPGNTAAATVIAQMRMTFPNIRFGLLVGIGGGVSTMTDAGMIRLGDVVVTQDLAAKRARSRRGDPVVANIGRIETRPPALRKFKFPGAHEDYLYPPEYVHREKGVSCDRCQCDPGERIPRDTDDSWNTEGDIPAVVIHRGTIASGERVIKDGNLRDKLAAQDEVLCFEMEAAGALADFPCLVIRGISDYCDSHKNDQWHGYAAASAAAYAREIFFHLPIDKLKRADSPYPIENKLNILMERSDDQERQAIMNWLSQIDYRAFQADYLDQMKEGTGQWFLRSDAFQYCVDTPSTLFCPGIPGAGKTVITSMVNLVHFLASILKQLIQQSSFIPEQVASLCSPTINASPREQQMLDCLQTMASGYSKIYLVVDALDECEESTRNKLIRKIFNLQSKTNIGFLTTSRFIPEITSLFAEFPSLEINASVDDIRLYLTSRINELPNFVSRDPSLQELVCSTITELVDGMFLVAKLYIDSLRKKRSIRALKDALSDMPGGSAAYDYAYQDAMHRIESQTLDEKTLSKQVMCWLTCSQRPLTLTELQHALAVKPGERAFDDENLSDIRAMITPCAGLVVFDDRSHIIRLVHYTTQDYFQRTWTRWFPEGHHYIAEACITYLSYDIFEAGACEKERDEQSSLHMAVFLGLEDFIPDLLKTTHVDAQSSSGETPLLFAAQMGHTDIARLLLDHGANPEPREQVDRSPLLQAAKNGHEAVLCLLLNRFSDQRHDSQKSKRTPAPRLVFDEDEECACGPDTLPEALTVAAANGHAKIVDILLHRGAEVNALCRSHNPVTVAAKNGDEATIRVLIEHGFDINHDGLCDRYFRTPLGLGIAGGHSGVVKLLLEQGAVIEEDTALVAAAECGRVEIMALLLEHGARLSSHQILNLIKAAAEKNNFAMPLLWAAKQGYTPMVETLLEEQGFDIDEKHQIYGTTALSLAAQQGHSDVVQVLLARGANQSCPDNLGRTPLMRATENSKKRVVRQLLEHNSSLLHHRDIFGRSPLLCAAEMGNSTIVEIFQGDEIEKRVYSHIISKEIDEVIAAVSSMPLAALTINGSECLSWAARYGHANVVETLLRRGIDSYALAEYGDRVLECAITYGHEGLLLDWGLGLTGLESRDRATLLLAIAIGNEATVGHLLEHNVPLSLDCVWKGNGNIVKMLLEHAEIRNIAVRNVEVAASLAIVKNHPQIVEILLNSQSTTHKYDDLLFQEAMEHRHKDVLRVLLTRYSGPGYTPKREASQLVFRAAAYGFIEAVDLLISKVIDPNCSLKSKITVSKFTAVTAFLSERSLLNQDNWPRRSVRYVYQQESDTPLLAAAANGHAPVVKLLLEKGALPEKKALPELIGRSRGRHSLKRPANIKSPLDAAIEGGHWQVIRLLLIEGCEWSPKTDLDTSLMHASYDGNAEMVNVLLERGVNPNTRNEGGTTPLIWSIVMKHKEIVKSLLAAGADPNFIGTDSRGFRGSKQFSPLNFASIPGKWSAEPMELEILKDLLDAGANVNLRDGVYRTPLSWAAERRSRSVLQILLDAGSEIDSIDRCNRTPLFYATMNDNAGAVKDLLERGSMGTTIQTSADRNPLDVARELNFLILSTSC